MSIWLRKGLFPAFLSALPLAVLLALTLLSQGCRYPQDPNNTLERVEDGVIHVGAVENPPWVIRTPSGAEGLEAELVRSFAESLNAEIRWYWGAESELITALSKHELDLMIAGLTKGAPFRHLMGLTKPYMSTDITVGVPAGQTLPASLEGVTVGKRHLDAIAGPLKDHGAKPVPVEDLTGGDIPVAAPRWWLEAHGFEVGRWLLRTYKHIMAVPPGENAWLMALQRHLNSRQGLNERLTELEAAR